MLITCTKKQELILRTDTLPAEWELDLKAEGTEEEIDWLMAQITKIGKEEKKK